MKIVLRKISKEDKQYVSVKEIFITQAQFDNNNYYEYVDENELPILNIDGTLYTIKDITKNYIDENKDFLLNITSENLIEISGGSGSGGAIPGLDEVTTVENETTNSISKKTFFMLLFLEKIYLPKSCNNIFCI